MMFLPKSLLDCFVKAVFFKILLDFLPVENIYAHGSQGAFGVFWLFLKEIHAVRVIGMQQAVS